MGVAVKRKHFPYPCVRNLTQPTRCQPKNIIEIFVMRGKRNGYPSQSTVVWWTR